MGLIGGGPRDLGDPTPMRRMSRRPPKVWATITIEPDVLVVDLKGWRAVWATKRKLQVPLQAVMAVQHDPGAYVHIRTRLRGQRRAASTTFKLGAQHSRDGWSFWSCGLARNAVVIETVGVRYRFIVLEVADPESVVARVRTAAGIKEPPPPVAPTVRPITDSKLLRRDQAGPPPARRPRSHRPAPARVTSIAPPPREQEVARSNDAAGVRPGRPNVTKLPKRSVPRRDPPDTDATTSRDPT